MTLESWSMGIVRVLNQSWSVHMHSYCVDACMFEFMVPRWTNILIIIVAGHI